MEIFLISGDLICVYYFAFITMHLIYIYSFRYCSKDLAIYKKEVSLEVVLIVDLLTKEA